MHLRDAGRPDGGDEPTGPFERLLVADALTPVVHVVELTPDSVLQSFQLESPARLYTGSDGLFGYAVQGDADLVSVLSSGLTLEAHGDHHDEVRSNAALLPFEARGDYPVHFVAHDGYVVLFFDNEGRAQIIDEASLASGAPDVRSLSAAHPHHGVALVFRDQVLITRPELLSGATRATPTGIAVHTLDGLATGDVFGCTSVHGEATLDDLALFGCSEGALVVEHGASGFTGRLIPNPPSAATPAPRVGTVLVHPALGHAIGNYGNDALSAIDPIANSITPHPLGERYVQFDITPDGTHLLVLTRGGELVVRDPLTFGERALSRHLRRDRRREPRRAEPAARVR